MFDHDDVQSRDASFKMMPPLREPLDRQALVEGLRAGIIDVVATDHAPHSTAEKDVLFEDAANGVTGLEWAAAVTNEVVGLSQPDFFQRMSVRPALIAEFEHHGRPLEPGVVANIVVFDPSKRWIPTSTLSKSQNAPYLGTELTGQVKVTVFGGRITHEVGP
jgi:dihydroorotase